MRIRKMLLPQPRFGASVRQDAHVIMIVGNFSAFSDTTKTLQGMRTSHITKMAAIAAEFRRGEMRTEKMKEYAVFLIE